MAEITHIKCYNKHMLLIGLFSWWYGAGWLQLIHRTLARIGAILDFFSIGLLLKTLFSPFKQISVGRVNGPIGLQLRAFLDLQISRVIGAMVRLAVIGFGLIATLLTVAVALALLVIWPFVPLLPIIATLIILGGF